MYPFISSTMSNKEYHSRSELSKSSLDKIAKSVRHYLSLNTFPPESTPAMVVGSLLHTVVLEPHLLDNEYIVEPSFDRRTAKGKTEAASFEASVGDRTAYKQEWLDLALAMKESVLSCKTTQALLKDATLEHSAFWIDEESGVPCRCRPDIAWGDSILADLKTTEDIEKFKWTVKDRNYHKQAAMYLDGYSIATGKQFKDFIFIVIEKKPPHGVMFYSLCESAIEVGRKAYKSDLMKWAKYKQDGIITSYPDEVVPLEIKFYD